MITADPKGRNPGPGWWKFPNPSRHDSSQIKMEKAKKQYMVILSRLVIIFFSCLL